MTEDERWTAVLLPPTPIVDTADTGNDTEEDAWNDTGKDTAEDTGKDTADNTAKKMMDGTPQRGPSVGESETVDQFISRLGLTREEAEVVENLLKTHDFLKEKDLIENVIRTARE